MDILLQAFWWVTFVELCVLLIPSLWWRRICTPFVCIALSAVSAGLLAVHPSLPMLCIVVISAYRIVNMFRIVRARMHEKYLRRTTRQTSLWAIAAQGIVLALWITVNEMNISTYRIWMVLLYFDVVCASLLLWSTWRSMRKTRVPLHALDAQAHQSELPTLTVAIPARNETDDLEACLHSIIASDYPKLEILVLDDCSQNRRTPEIIRSFAHDGVRFIQGEVPADNWLAKNQAYQQLLNEANGDLVLFCGVDVRFEPHSLRTLISAMEYKHKTMMSLIPRNELPAQAPFIGAMLVQPMRYAWELALPRRQFRRPPVLSTCWIARRDLLTAAGGFAAVSRSVVPESYFARMSMVHDGYSFMQSDGMLGIISAKRFSEQVATAVRTRYPQVHRRIELVMALTMAELVGIVLPYVLFAFGIFGNISLQLTIVSALTIAVLTATYALVVYLTYHRRLLRVLWLPLFAVCMDVGLLNYSMVEYEFFEVIWKDRNVCVPVMRTVEHLPGM
jgi:glycosyltransferase involved in cell wall biosynthesis